jgi:hypothetical protein
MSKKKCSICAHPEALAISSALGAGLHQKKVAEQFNISKFALSRHVNRCLTPPAANGESAGDQLDRWLRRADEIFIKASVDGNLAAQVSSLSTAIRALQAAQKAEEKNAEQPETVTDYLDRCIAENAWLAETEPSEVLKMFTTSMDEGGQAAQSALRDELHRYADCWLRLRSGIAPIEESWRLLRLHFSEMHKKYDEQQVRA